MTILFFCRFFYPHIGGVEKHVLEISKQLTKLGHKVYVVAERHDTSLAPREVYKGITIYRIPIRVSEKEKKYTIWNWLFKHRKLILKAAVVHCHDVFFWYFPFRILFPQKKVFTTFHGYEGNMLPSKRAVMMHKLAEALSKGNICVGDYLKKWYGTKTDIVTYGAVSIPQDLNTVQLLGNPIRIVYIGRLAPEAGIMMYLRAISLLKTKGYSASLLVLGDGELFQEAEAFVKLNNLPVVFKGFTSDIHTYLAAADIVFTSRFLGTLEAFAFRKYVFCVFNNPIKKDYYLLSPFRDWVGLSGNSSELAEQIVAYLANPSSIQKDVEDAFRWARKQTWSKLTAEYLRLWKK